MSDNKAFSPWRENYRVAGIAGLIAIAAATLAVMKMVPPFVGFGLAIVAAGVALRSMQRGQSREFGKRFEEMHLARAVPLLQKAGVVCIPNYGMRSGADIDLVVEYEGKKITVEIKSFIKWNAFLFFWPGEREKNAIRQANRQMTSINATAAIIWLPQGRPSFLQSLFKHYRESNVRLVFGGARMLERAIKGI